MLLMTDIIREGNPKLNEKAHDVTLPLSSEDEDILLSMIEYIDNSIDEEIASTYHLRPAVGLAAPQIGVLKKMIAIYATDEHGEDHFYAMVNPKLISYSDELTYLTTGEGCLSVDRDVEGYVHRPRTIRVSTYLYDDGKLKQAVLRLKGYMAVVFQHEYDHLNGILFPERINKENPLYIPVNSVPIVFKSEEEENPETEH